MACKQVEMCQVLWFDIIQELNSGVGGYHKFLLTVMPCLEVFILLVVRVAFMAETIKSKERKKTISFLSYFRNHARQIKFKKKMSVNRKAEMSGLQDYYSICTLY